jgi:hypothetical protein
MTIAVESLLSHFDSLSENEKREAATEILRRSMVLGEGDLTESTLTEVADRLFIALDEEEAGNAHPTSR